MSEKMRDGFESWCKTLGFNIDKFDGDYIIASTDWAWKIWQASRAALVVELPPELEEGFIDSYQEGWNDAIDSCRARFESTGATCK